MNVDHSAGNPPCSCAVPARAWLALRGFLALIGICSATCVQSFAENTASRPSAAAPAVSSLENYLGMLGYAGVAFNAWRELPFVVSARVGEEKLTLLVDTGCPTTTIDQRRVAGLHTLGDLHLSVKDELQGELKDPSLLLIPKLFVGQCEFSNQPARGAVLEGRHQKFDNDGVIGLDFLYRNFCLIDCTDKKLYFHGTKPTPEQARALALSLKNSGFSAIPMTCSKRLMVESLINDQPSLWMLDTGASISLIDAPTANRFKLRPIRADHPQIGSMLARDLEATVIGFEKIGVGTLRVRVVSLPALTIGPRKWADFAVGLVDIDFSAKEPPQSPAAGIHGLLGDEFLVGRGAIIDLPGNTLWLRPERKPSS